MRTKTTATTQQGNGSNIVHSHTIQAVYITHRHQTIKPVVTGQARITLEWKITSGGKTREQIIKDNRVFAKVSFSKCTSLKIVPKAAFAVHF